MREAEATIRRRWSGEALPAAALDATVRRTRLLAMAALVVWPCLWHGRTTGAVSAPALALLIAIVLSCVAFGRTFARWTRGILPSSPGIAYEVLVGFLIGNTLLFVLTLASPLGIGWHLSILAVLAAVCALTHREGGPHRSKDAEAASLAAIVFAGLFATLWTVDQQPMIVSSDGQSVFRVWFDVFIHAREISAFAQSHGLWSLSDIKAVGVAAPVYHFASYMVPAALNALTGTSALDAYAAFQLPFGLLLTGLAAYALTAVMFRATWPAVLAVAVLALPDAYQQGFGLRYLSYHFMSQVNLGMLYGIACMSAAWLFMVESCRRQRFAGVIVAFVLLAVCVGYKAHLFVANAALLMLYPCIFFGRFRSRWRVLAIVVLGIAYVSAVVASQSSPRVPTLRLDGSGLGDYIQLLMGGFSKGRFRMLFEALYFESAHPPIVGVVLAIALILLTSFGVWLALFPIAVWWQRRAIDPGALAFIAMVFINYLVMSTGLALDERGVGAPEEFLNRPHAWAYFVVVASGVAILASGALGRRAPSKGAMVVIAAFTCALIGFVQAKATNLETFPEWKTHVRYDQFNAAPTCLVRSAVYIRDHARVGEVIQDSQFDERLLVTSVAERQEFVSTAAFGGRTDLTADRIAAFRAVMAARDGSAFIAWLRARRIHWFVLQPEDAAGWTPGFLETAVFDCEGFRVFRLGG